VWPSNHPNLRRSGAAWGTGNHVHLLIALPAAMPLAKAIQDLKGNSSRWLNQHGSAFVWQEGYATFRIEGLSFAL
jgi:putative transposase